MHGKSLNPKVLPPPPPHAYMCTKLHMYKLNACSVSGEDGASTSPYVVNKRVLAFIRTADLNNIAMEESSALKPQ